MKKKILYLFSDTGGGHRSAATAIMRAVDELYKTRVSQEMVDVFAECSSFLNVFARLYAPVIKYSPKLWGQLYYWLDDEKKLEQLEQLSRPLILKELKKLLHKQKPDVIVSVHPMVNHLTVKAIYETGLKIPFVVVITDPVTLHRAWIVPQVDLCIVATPEARERAIKYGMPDEKIKVVGMPIDPKFAQKKSRVEKQMFTVLLMGGGEGAGKMEEIVDEFERTGFDGQLIVITGRNKQLEKKLHGKADQFSFPIRVYGFTNQVYELMSESDMIITKAGPGTIAEALAMNLPIIITSWLPGQEEGNVEFVEKAKVGRVSEDPTQIVKLVKHMRQPAQYELLKRHIKKVSHPQAALEIARNIFKLVAVFLLLISGLWVACSGAFAEEYLLDVPKGHWANEAVYSLIKMGVTAGYPDGTYRGDKNLSRFEAASFISRFAQSLHRQAAIDDKMLAELRSEVELLKFERQQALHASGRLDSRAGLATLPARQGRLDFRFIGSLSRNFDKNTSCKITLDTLDAGYGTATPRSITTNMLDIEGKFTWANLDWKVALGPGTIAHVESDSFFPADSHTIFDRPQSGIEASGALGRMDYSMAYIARGVQTSGLVNLNEIAGKVNYRFGAWAVNFVPHYLFNNNGARNIVADAGLDFKLHKHWTGSVLLSGGSFRDGRGIRGQFIGKMLDPWDKGTNLTLSFDRISSRYKVDDLDPFEFVFLNNFDRLILNGTSDLGITASQRLTDKILLQWKSDYVVSGSSNYGVDYAGTYYLYQAGLLCRPAGNWDISAFYRVYNVPSGMAQFSEAVPTRSDMIGLKVSCAY